MFLQCAQCLRIIERGVQCVTDDGRVLTFCSAACWGLWEGQRVEDELRRL